MEREIKYAIKAVDKTKQAFKDVEKNANAAGGSIKDRFNAAFASLGKHKLALAGIATAFVGANVAAVKFANSMAKVNDEIAKNSKKLQLPINQYQDLAYVLEINGTKIESARASFSRLQGNIAQAGRGSKQAQELFNKLGMSITDSEGKTKTAGQVFQEATLKLAGMTDPGEKAALAVQLFGRSYQELMPLLSNSNKELAKTYKEAERFRVVSEKMAKSSEDNVDAQTRLSKTWTKVKNAFAEKFIDGATEQIELFTGVLESLIPVAEFAGSTINLMVKSFTTIYDALLLAGVGFEQLGTLIALGMTKSVTLVLSGSEKIVKILDKVPFLDKFTEGALDKLSELKSGFEDTSDELVKEIKETEKKSDAIIDRMVKRWSDKPIEVTVNAKTVSTTDTGGGGGGTSSKSAIEELILLGSIYQNLKDIKAKYLKQQKKLSGEDLKYAERAAFIAQKLAVLEFYTSNLTDAKTKLNREFEKLGWEVALVLQRFKDLPKVLMDDKAQIQLLSQTAAGLDEVFMQLASKGIAEVKAALEEGSITLDEAGELYATIGRRIKDFSAGLQEAADKGIFGAEGLLSSSVKAYEAIAAAIEELEASLDETRESFKFFGEAGQQLGAQLMNVFVGIGSSMTPVVNGIARVSSAFMSNADLIIEGAIGLKEAFGGEEGGFSKLFFGEEGAEGFVALLSFATEATNTMLSSLGSLLEMSHEKRMNYLQEEKDAVTEQANAEKDALKKQLTTRRQYERGMSKIEEKAAAEQAALDKKMEEEKKKAAKNALMIQLVQSIASTALGITQALASGPPPLSIVMAGIVGGMGTVAQAMILAQMSKFAEGGIVGGNSFTGDNQTVRVNSGEMVLNRRQQANLFDIANGKAGNTSQPLNVDMSLNIEGNVTEDTLANINDARDQQLLNLKTMLEELNYRNELNFALAA